MEKIVIDAIVKTLDEEGQPCVQLLDRHGKEWHIAGELLDLAVLELSLSISLQLRGFSIADVQSEVEQKYHVLFQVPNDSKA